MKSKFTFVLMIFCITTFCQSERLNIAVSDLVAQGVKESEAAVISEQLRAELMKSPRIKLIERSQMEEVLKEQGFQQSGCTGDECAVEVGQLLGVKNMIVGSVGMAGSYIVLSIRIIDAGTGAIIVNESIKLKGGIDNMIESGIGIAVEKLNSGLFPETRNSNQEASVKKPRKRAKAVLIGGGSAILIGGGIIAAVLLNKDDTSEQTNIPNTEIELP